MEYDYEVQSKYIKALAHAWLVAHDNFKYDPDDMEVIGSIVQALHFFSLVFKIRI